VIIRSLMAGSLALLLAACHSDSAVGPNRAALSLEDELTGKPGIFRRIAWIHFGQGQDSVVFIVPGHARVGQPVQAVITTYGGGCISEDTTFVSVSGMSAEITPMQRVYYGGACTMEMRITRRPITLVFDKPGVANVRVTGRANPGDSLIAARRWIQISP
jgi:hypothetical protein